MPVTSVTTVPGGVRVQTKSQIAALPVRIIAGGTPGAPIFLPGEDGDDGFPIPGPAGAAAAGSSLEAALTSTVNADFNTWVNQGGTAAVADTSWGWTLTDSADSNVDSLRQRVKSALSLTGSWTAIARIQRGYLYIGNMVSGMLLRESATSKIVTCGWAHPGVTLNRWTNSTTFGSSQTGETATHPLKMWIKLVWDQPSNKYQFFVSDDGRVWAEASTAETLTTHFTTTFDQIGFFINFNRAALTKIGVNMQLGVSSFTMG